MAQLHGALADVLAHQQEEERERALRALLMRPLLAAGSAEFALARRHGDYAREWLAREAGWNLQMDRECIRLYKRPASADDTTRGLADFDRERYVLLSLACAALERAESQVTLRALGERLLEAAADPELAARGFSYAMDSARERRNLVQVCRFLLEHGVLSRVAGDEESFVSQSGDVLYDVHRRVLAALPASTRGASLIAAVHPQLGFEERLHALLDEYVPDSPEGRRTAIRHRLARRLLDDPVTYHDELTADEHDYFMSQRGPMAARLASALGLAAELRAEGVALVDPQATMSDEHMPAVGTEAHATLLVAEHLAQTARGEFTGTSEPLGKLHSLHEIAAFLRSAADQYGRYWRKNAREPGAELELAEQAVMRLEALKLIRRIEGGVQPRPALLRYALGAVEVRERQEGLL